MHVDIDALDAHKFTDQNTLRELLVKQVFLDPQVAQRIYNSLPAALHLTLRELAGVAGEQLLAMPLIKMKHVRALNELLTHFGLSITAPLLTEEQRIAILEAYGLSQPAGLAKDGRYYEGYLVGMASALDMSIEDMVAMAQTQKEWCDGS